MAEFSSILLHLSYFPIVKNFVMKFCLYFVEAGIILRIFLKHVFYIKPNKLKSILKINLVLTFYA